MQLSGYSDYSIRVLMQAALRDPERLTVKEVAETFNLSSHHLVKVVHDLGRSGFLKTHRGAGGGFTLARPSQEIRLGDVVRLGEEVETVIDCLNGGRNRCRLYPSCQLKKVLDEAAAAFFAVLDRYTLADVVKQPQRMRSFLGMHN